jgi:hypothetical protein
MKNKLHLFWVILLTACQFAHAQTPVRTEKVGHVFSIAVPEYMVRTLGISDAASVQFKNDEKEIYTYIIEDSKADLALVDLKFASAKEFYDEFVKDFLLNAKDRNFGTPKIFEKDGVNFVQVEATYYDKDAKTKIYYNITIAETKGYFYKILTFTSEANKTKLRDELFLMGASIRD